MLRTLINFLIAGIWILLFQLFGWLKITADFAIFHGFPHLNEYAIAVILGAVFTIALWVASILWKLVLGLTCGLGCVLLPFYLGAFGFAGFWAIQHFLPNWITVTDNMWLIIAMGLIIAIVRIPTVSVKVTYTVTRKTRNIE